MKRYTTKQLQAMTPDELEKAKEEALAEFNEAGRKLQEILNKKDNTEEEE